MIEAAPPEIQAQGDGPTRAGFVAILGAPNVGKSTLLNQLVGTKVSIVSPKVQTTRRRIIGISMQESTQILFVDTPGIFVPRKRLERAMVQAAWAAAADADLCLSGTGTEQKQNSDGSEHQSDAASNTAMTPSPTPLSTVPPCRSTVSLSVRSCVANKSSAARSPRRVRWLVLSTTSVNTTVAVAVPDLPISAPGR